MNEKTAEKTSLEIIRFINAPPARVYDAWTDPAQLRNGLDQKTYDQEYHCGRASRWKISLGPDRPEGRK